MWLGYVLRRKCQETVSTHIIGRRGMAFGWKSFSPLDGAGYQKCCIIDANTSLNLMLGTIKSHSKIGNIKLVRAEKICISSYSIVTIVNSASAGVD